MNRRRDGRRDVLRDLVQSCEKYGLRLGVHLSPADLYHIEAPGGYYGNGSEFTERVIPRKVENRPFKVSRTFTYLVDDYNEYFLNQMFELLTEYGSIYEVWFDGANPKPGTGQTYTYDAWYEMIYELAETNTSIRHGWFWRNDDEQQVRSADAFRLTIIEARLEPSLAHISAHYYDEPPEPVVIRRDSEGMVEMGVGLSFEWNHHGMINLSQPVYYTLDGSEPAAGLIRYKEPLSLPPGGFVRARAIVEGREGPVSEMRIGILRRGWTSYDSAGSELVIFTSDNGTEEGIPSFLNGNEYFGGKLTSTNAGTHVPLITNWKGVVPDGVVNNDLICFKYFFPTLAGIAGSALHAGLKRYAA